MLNVRTLTISIPESDGQLRTLVDEIEFYIKPKTTLALVGKSGSGKSLTAYAVMGLLPPTVKEDSNILFAVAGENRNLTQVSQKLRRSLRGSQMAMVFQEPMTALNPAMTIGRQLAEVLVEHCGFRWKEAKAVALKKLRLVGIHDPERCLKQFPHELSGGMRQRVVIAMALMADARLLIADEPTTALDVTIQAQILDLLKDLQASLGLTILLITHDMGVVADMAHRVCVMQNGKIVESGDVDTIFSSPSHHYTQQLLADVPTLGTAVRNPQHFVAEPLVSVRNLRVEFSVRQGTFARARVLSAVAGVDLDIHPGETVGLVGESGCGKTTLGRALLGLAPMSAGEVRFDGMDLGNLTKVNQRRFRRETTMIFQDPDSSLNPRMRVGDIIAEPMEVHRLGNPTKHRTEVIELLLQVGLTAEMADRYSNEFSGGERQRIGIARALALRPRFIVCDEPTSALDVSIQAEIIELLLRLKKEFSLTLLFISHALATVEQVADRIAVMYLGHIVEIGTTAQIISDPRHPYTRALISAAPVPNPLIQKNRQRTKLHGSPPSPINPPSGCVFHTRCQNAYASCHTTPQMLAPLDDERQVACNIPAAIA